MAKITDILGAGGGDVTQHQVVKVSSINYTFTKGIKTPIIDTLEVDVRFNRLKETVMKKMENADVIKMQGCSGRIWAYFRV